MQINTKAMIVCAWIVTGWLRAGEAPELNWDPAAGVQVKTPEVTVQWDGNDKLAAPVLKSAGGGELLLKNPQVSQPDAKRLHLSYVASLPGGPTINVVRELSLTCRGGETDLVEEFKLTSDSPVTEDLEIRRPFTITSSRVGSTASAVCPLFNGWARPFVLSENALNAEYRVGAFMNGSERLALPVVQLDRSGAWRGALMSDCRFSALFSTRVDTNGTVRGMISYRYACSKVPLKGTEVRRFGLWLAPDAGEPFGKSVDSFFRLMLPEVQPGPKWLHDVAMVYYDYLSENGAGWEKDLNELARWVKPEERGRVALCFHGWYETIGGYGYDDATGKMKTQWTAMERTRKVQLSQDEVRRRLKFAKQLGFRVLLYFADGLLQDSKAPFPGCYNADWDWKDAAGNRRTGWQGPDTWGKTYVRNPSHPEVVKWYGRYLNALLSAYGPEVDGFVWDETFHIPLGGFTRVPEPAYCDRGMLDLVKTLCAQLKTVDAEKAFLVSDCAGASGNMNYAMMADGTFQDSGCKPAAWSYGLFPNWRNTLWSCNWGSVARFLWTRWGVETLGTPVSISNGYGDDKGPWEWTPEFRDRVIELFHQRLARKPVRFLTDDPAKLLASLPEAPVPSDPLPSPVTTTKIRLVVRTVAPLDSIARLLQVEAWGRE